MICADCGIRNYKSDMRWSQEFHKYICNSHYNVPMHDKEEEYKEYKVGQLAKMTYRSRFPDQFRPSTQTWDTITLLWETWDTPWEDS